MIDLNSIREHMEIIGADGVHLGTVDKLEGDRIKMTRADSGSHAVPEGAAPSGPSSGHHHYISVGLIAAVEDNRVRLSANARNAALLEEEEGGEALSDLGQNLAEPEGSKPIAAHNAARRDSDPD